MKYIVWTIGTLFIILLAYLGLQTAASERVEVVELHTTNESGEEQVTRLWVVDHGGFAYLRAGHAASGWYLDLKTNPTIKLTRGETTANFTASIDADAQTAINDLMQKKYTWGETFIGTLFSRDNSIPVRLTALEK